MNHLLACPVAWRVLERREANGEVACLPGLSGSFAPALLFMEGR